MVIIPEQQFEFNQEIEKVKYGVWADGHFIWLIDQENWVYETSHNEKHIYTKKILIFQSL
ncbi:hypothetical protein KHA80_03370 [Anaerobacillus sp. HL2]|nr:hypothetical protein KHA80_03370 [Anaerobacillus sp. HL2]